jgi:hypothetical protein
MPRDPFAWDGVVITHTSLNSAQQRFALSPASRPNRAGASRVLRVFCLNANPAFSVRANFACNTQSAGVAVIHRAVAVPPFWSALSKPAAPRTAMGDAAFPRGTNITVVDFALLAFTENDSTNFNMYFEVVIG